MLCLASPLQQLKPWLIDYSFWHRKLVLWSPKHFSTAKTILVSVLKSVRWTDLISQQVHAVLKTYKCSQWRCLQNENAFDQSIRTKNDTTAPIQIQCSMFVMTNDNSLNTFVRCYTCHKTPWRNSQLSHSKCLQDNNPIQIITMFKNSITMNKTKEIHALCDV